MIDEKKIMVDGKEFVISKLPAVTGREILFKYTAGGKNILMGGDYTVSEEVMKKLFSYIGVYVDGRLIELKSEELINNHVQSAMTLIKLEKEMMSYNFDFFTPEKISAFFQQFHQLADKESMKILTALWERLLNKDEQHSKS
jgi:hypothetical protein